VVRNLDTADRVSCTWQHVMSRGGECTWTDRGAGTGRGADLCRPPPVYCVRQQAQEALGSWRAGGCRHLRPCMLAGMLAGIWLVDGLGAVQQQTRARSTCSSEAAGVEHGRQHGRRQSRRLVSLETGYKSVRI
jgi:hypothetical protein